MKERERTLDDILADADALDDCIPWYDEQESDRCLNCGTTHPDGNVQCPEFTE